MILRPVGQVEPSISPAGLVSLNGCRDRIHDRAHTSYEGF